MKPKRLVTIGKIQGKVKTARVQRTRTSSDVVHHYTATEMHINERIFDIPDEAFGLIEDGASYAVYFWDGLGEIFSLELLHSGA